MAVQTKRLWSENGPQNRVNRGLKVNRGWADGGQGHCGSSGLLTKFNYRSQVVFAAKNQ